MVQPLSVAMVAPFAIVLPQSACVPCQARISPKIDHRAQVTYSILQNTRRQPEYSRPSCKQQCIVPRSSELRRLCRRHMTRRVRSCPRCHAVSVKAFLSAVHVRNSRVAADVPKAVDARVRLRPDRSRAVEHAQPASSTARFVCVASTGGVAVRLGHLGSRGGDTASTIWSLVSVMFSRSPQLLQCPRTALVVIFQASILQSLV